MSPAIGFICPTDEVKILLTDCRKACRLGKRCMTRASLRSILPDKPRTWQGRVGVTQCLGGTRSAYLQFTEDFYINPYSRVFSMWGSAAHAGLEASGDSHESVLERYFRLRGIGGIIDCYELEAEVGTLTDYKFVGSFAVAKGLGLVRGGKIPDPSGALYKKSGSWGKAGTPKMVVQFVLDPDAIDMWEWKMQLNLYRIMLWEEGLKVDVMQVQAGVRDGNSLSAHNRGLHLPMYLITIPRLDDKYVLTYFEGKRDALIHAMEHGELPPPCNHHETWDGRKCEDYCDVWQHCNIGQRRHVREG